MKSHAPAGDTRGGQRAASFVPLRVEHRVRQARGRVLARGVFDERRRVRGGRERRSKAVALDASRVPQRRDAGGDDVLRRRAGKPGEVRVAVGRAVAAALCFPHGDAVADSPVHEGSAVFPGANGARHKYVARTDVRSTPRVDVPIASRASEKQSESERRRRSSIINTACTTPHSSIIRTLYAASSHVRHPRTRPRALRVGASKAAAASALKRAARAAVTKPAARRRRRGGVRCSRGARRGRSFRDTPDDVGGPSDADADALEGAALRRGDDARGHRASFRTSAGRRRQRVHGGVRLETAPSGRLRFAQHRAHGAGGLGVVEHERVRHAVCARAALAGTSSPSRSRRPGAGEVTPARAPAARRGGEGPCRGGASGRSVPVHRSRRRAREPRGSNLGVGRAAARTRRTPTPRRGHRGAADIQTRESELDWTGRASGPPRFAARRARSSSP